jgi:GT2 family glycosyltransferase
MAPEITYAVVNTNGRDYLMGCLAAIEAHHPRGVEREILVLDNASNDGSAEAARALDLDLEVIELTERTGKAANDSLLLSRARGEFCLLLNEDSELLPGAVEALLDAMRSDESAGAAGAQLLDSEGNPVPCAWRFPGVGTAAVGALFLHRFFTVQSGGSATRRVDWAQSSAMLVRRSAAEAVGYLDPDFFVYYDECDLCLRLRGAGWHTLYVPAARAKHHDQLSTDLEAGLPRIVEFHRNRDLFMRKHHNAVAAIVVRVLTAWAYAIRSLIAAIRGRDEAAIHRAHARQALFPARGVSLRDRASAARAQSPPQGPSRSQEESR